MIFSPSPAAPADEAEAAPSPAPADLVDPAALLEIYWPYLWAGAKPEPAGAQDQ
jgi:hypothetical protein